MMTMNLENVRAIALAERWFREAQDRFVRENTDDSRFEVNLARENLDQVYEDILRNGVDSTNN